MYFKLFLSQFLGQAKWHSACSPNLASKWANQHWIVQSNEKSSIPIGNRLLVVILTSGDWLQMTIKYLKPNGISIRDNPFFIVLPILASCISLQSAMDRIWTCDTTNRRQSPSHSSILTHEWQRFFLQVVTSLEDAKQAQGQGPALDGKARAKYRFTGETPMELNFNKVSQLMQSFNIFFYINPYFFLTINEYEP